MAKQTTALPAYENITLRGGEEALHQLDRFFMKIDAVHATVHSLAKKLDELGIPYAIAGAMALNAHGFQRATVDVDVLVTEVDLRRIHRELEGLGYVPPFVGSKNLRDTRTTVRIDFLIAGQFPGDGKPKPVAFPEPNDAAVTIEGIHYLGLPPLVELKLASGMTNAGRLKDLGDVQELIRVLSLKRDFASNLNPFVQAKYLELWDGVASSPEEER